jgi:hypothetical protein
MKEVQHTLGTLEQLTPANSAVVYNWKYSYDFHFGRKATTTKPLALAVIPASCTDQVLPSLLIITIGSSRQNKILRKLPQVQLGSLAQTS